MARKLKIVIGQTFERLTIISEANAKNGHTMCSCACKCGVIVIVRLSALINGNTQSCGCLNDEGRARLGKSKSKPGVKNDLGKTTTEYNSWRHIKARCYNKKNNKYHIYGAMGITVCDRWLNSFENFLAYMGNCPVEMNSIDRKDVNGNYESGNCRWANDEMQSSNKQNKIHIEYEGVEYTQASFARLLGINPKSVEFQRKRGKSSEQIANIYKHKEICS